MEINDNGFWVYFSVEDNLIPEKTGKWMYFFYNSQSDILFVNKICTEAINKNVVKICKHTAKPILDSKGSGVVCFYLNGDDMEGHKRVIKFFLENNLIKKTKSGKYTNISFKFDNQTRNNEYGDGFEAKIQLSDFIDLQSGIFIK